MQHCLYDPVEGYYRKRDRIFGEEGDFITSPYTHPLFAELLADAFASCYLHLGRPKTFHLVELGAGEGVLARDLLSVLQIRHREVFDQAEYRPVELETPEIPSGIRGVVFSNEFFDALPVHRVRVRKGELRELYVRRSETGWIEEEGPLSDPRIEAYMRSGFPTWREGWLYEVNLRMVEVLAELEKQIESGWVVTIDYGYRWAEYNARDRPQGTLLCYSRHRAGADPYQRIGEQDMTAHLNFEILEQTGESFGWQSEPLKTQREFLMEWGLEEKLKQEEGLGLFNPDRLRHRLRLKNLLIPGGLSDTLKVLVQKVRLD